MLVVAFRCDEVWEFVPQTFHKAGGVQLDGIQECALRFTTSARVVLFAAMLLCKITVLAFIFVFR